MEGKNEYKDNITKQIRIYAWMHVIKLWNAYFHTQTVTITILSEIAGKAIVVVMDIHGDVIARGDTYKKH